MKNYFLYFFALIVLVVVAIAVKHYTTAEQSFSSIWKPDEIKPDLVSRSTTEVKKAPTQSPAAQEGIATLSQDYQAYQDPNQGQIELVSNQFAVADNDENRDIYPHGHAANGLWLVTMLPGMSRPEHGMFVIQSRGKFKVASGLMSVKLKDFEVDSQENLFEGAEIEKLRPEIGVVVYRFQNFEQMVQAKIKAENMTEVVRSEIEIIDRPRKSQ